MRGPKKRLTPFGKMVVKALADRDMSRAELAATVGTSPQYMRYLSRGYIREVVIDIGRSALSSN